MRADHVEKEKDGWVVVWAEKMGGQLRATVPMEKRKAEMLARIRAEEDCDYSFIVPVEAAFIFYDPEKWIKTS